MMLCCPHPDPAHDPAGDCTILHCGCHRIQAGARCACPYQDCYVLVTTIGEVCGACLAICVTAHNMEQPG